MDLIDTLVVAAGLAAVSCHPTKEPCDEQKAKAQIHAIEQLHEAAALGVIAAGKCDQFKGRPVTDCPAYAAIEASFKLSAEAVCR